MKEKVIWGKTPLRRVKKKSKVWKKLAYGDAYIHVRLDRCQNCNSKIKYLALIFKWVQADDQIIRLSLKSNQHWWPLPPGSLQPQVR